VVRAITAELVAASDGRLVDLLPLPLTSTSLLLGGRWDGQAVIAKVHITSDELFWNRLAEERSPGLFARLLLSGERLRGQAVNWLVVERLPVPLGPSWRGKQWWMVADAAARFQQLASTAPSERAHVEGPETIERWLHCAAGRNCPIDLTALVENVESDWAYVARVCPPTICFGDLHLGNAFAREPPPTSTRAVLIDPIPRIQPWLFDAAYCEANSADSGVGLCATLAETRAAIGLGSSHGPEFLEASALMLGWMATLWWGIRGFRRGDSRWERHATQLMANAVGRRGRVA
jgi:hypothetical protein